MHIEQTGIAMSSPTPDSPAPADETVVWRYLPHGNFERLLDPLPALRNWGIVTEEAPCPMEWQSFGSLWFAGPDLYRKKDVEKGGDPREGTFPALDLTDDEICRIGAARLGLSHEEAEKRKEMYLALNPAWIRERKKVLTRLCGVTCWHHNLNENMRMWRDYVGDKGVVILSTMAKLQPSLDTVWETVRERATTVAENGFITKFTKVLHVARLRFVHAKYIDMDNNQEDDDGYINVLRFKGEGFRHENEVRGIARSPFFADTTDNRLNTVTAEESDELLKAMRGGFNMSVELDKLIDEVRVHPGADDAYIAEIRGLLEAKGLSQVQVRRSELDSPTDTATPATP
jgi:hypothetical protein